VSNATENLTFTEKPTFTFTFPAGWVTAKTATQRWGHIEPH